MSAALPVMERLQMFLDAAAGEGLVFGELDAADLYIELFGDKPPAQSIAERHAESQKQEFYRVTREYTASCGHRPSNHDIWLLARGLMDTSGRRKK